MNDTPRGPLRDERVARRARREASVAARAAKREKRWTHFRYAVPYRTEGPKLTLGVLWFASMLAAAWIDGLLTIIPVSVAVAAAGLQISHAWLTDPAARGPRERIAAVVNISTFRFCGAALALLVALGGWGGAFGLGVSVVVVVLVAVLTGAWFGGTTSTARAIEVAAYLVRCSVPVGIAGGALVAVAVTESRAFVVLLVLISAYESADFVVGTGSSNAVEGPVAGVVGVAVAGFALRLIPPEPLTQDSLTAFAALTALTCVIGQFAGSAVLPRGGAFAPGLRRLDSPMITAPLWLLLLPIL